MGCFANDFSEQTTGLDSPNILLMMEVQQIIKFLRKHIGGGRRWGGFISVE